MSSWLPADRSAEDSRIPRRPAVLVLVFWLVCVVVAVVASSARADGTEFDYAQVTSSVTIAAGATTPAAATTVVTGGSHTYDGTTAYYFEFATSQLRMVAGPYLCLGLYEDGTKVADLLCWGPPGTATNDAPASGFLRYTPPAGTHTYSVRAYWTGGVTSASRPGSGTSRPSRPSPAPPNRPR